MYSRKIIEKNLDRERYRIRQLLRDKTFEFVEHSPSDCQHSRKYFHQTDSLGNEPNVERYKKNQLNADEIKWILNERALCRYDYLYFLTHYYHIETHDNRLILLNPNLAQRAQIQCKAELEEKGLGIEIQNLKARQVGVTTESEGDVCHRVTFYSNVNAVVASSNPAKSGLMAGKMETGWDNLPVFLLPQKGPPWNRQCFEFPEQNSAVSIQSGAQFNGVARGQTPTCAHLSELSEWNSPKDDVDNAMLHAMHSNPELMVILESTALMMNDWWHMTWKQSVAGKNRFTPRFYGWYLAPDFWPTETYMKKFPIPGDWVPSDRVKNHAEMARQYVLTDEVVLKIVGSGWQMSREQMWWYDREYRAAQERHAVNDFLREMPATPDEAWQVTGYSIFDADIILQHWEGCRQPAGVYGFRATSDTIPLRLQADENEVDRSKAPIEISCEWIPGHKVEGQLLPLKWKGYGTADETEGREKLFVWEWPRSGQQYGVSIDTSEGIGANQSVVEGIRKQTQKEFSEQIFEYASTWANPIDLINIAMLLGSLYSPPRKDGEPNQAKLIAEVKSESDITQFEMRKHGWYNFHHYISIDRVKLDPNQQHRLGWYTTPWSRKRILAWFIYNLKMGTFLINSPWLLQECKTLHRDIYEQQLRAETGAMDDRIMASSFGWYALHELDERTAEMQIMEMQQEVKMGAYKPQISEQQRQDLEDYTGMGLDFGSQSNIVIPQSDPVYDF